MIVPVYVIEEIRLNKKDMIIFCSDGISGYMQPDDLKNTLREENLLESMKTVINTAKENSIRERKCVRYDDLTLLVYMH